MLIRNLRKASDYSKAVQTQQELLRIAIANDANIAAARAGLKRGEIPTLSPIQQKSPAELQADVALQQQTAQNNLLRLFQYREVSQIISGLNNDEIFALNSLFPQIERDLKSRFANNLISPTFFIDYLKKTKQELDASAGVSTNLTNITNKFNVLTDNIEDIKAILPTRNQFTNLSNFLETELDVLPRVIMLPLLERIIRLEKAIPTKDELAKVGDNNELMQFELMNMLQNITSDMPTQNQLNMIIEDIRAGKLSNEELVKKIENAISGISDNQIDMLEEIKRDIVTTGGDDINIIAEVFVNTLKVQKLAIANKSGSKSSMGSIYIVTELGNEKLTLDKLKSLLKDDNDFKNWYQNNIGNSVNIGKLKEYIIINSNLEGISATKTISDATSKETFSTEKSGLGINRFSQKSKNHYKKIGEGIKFEPEPTYKEFGKYVINMPQLKERDILNVKFKSLGRIPQFKPTPISDVMKDFILELLETGKVSHRIYDQIPIDEKQLFEKIASGAGILNTLKIKQTISNEDKDDNNRFNLLRGEYLAGNNNATLLKELRKLVVKFITQNKISKHDGMNLLIELS
jgi:hypothetical protein